MIRLYIHGIGTMAVGHETPFSERTSLLETLPIQNYVPPKKSRRFGRLSKMVYLAAARALESAEVADPTGIPVINATGAGEAGASLMVLEQIHRTRGRLISPALVPNSVHNAPAGYLTIGLGNRAPSITVSQGWLSSEAAIAAAADCISCGIADRVLVSSGDEADPKWVTRLFELNAAPLAERLEEEAFQEGAVALVLASAPSKTSTGTVIATVERCRPDRDSIARLLERHDIRPKRDTEIRVRQSAGGKALRPLLAEVLSRPIESIHLDGKGPGTAHAYALSRLAAAVKDTSTDELLLLGTEVDEVAALHYERAVRISE
jgi:hypothetical protein